VSDLALEIVVIASAVVGAGIVVAYLFWRGG